jgi:hypothetical protein
MNTTQMWSHYLWYQVCLLSVLLKDVFNSQIYTALVVHDCLACEEWQWHGRPYEVLGRQPALPLCPETKIPLGLNPGMQSEKQVINGRTKDKEQHIAGRNYCREDRGSAFQRNIDNHEPGCLAIIFTDLFLIFHDVISNYRTLRRIM